ncbi:MAG TPA: choice-of-anchor A family protein [Gemmataceae bacterium]|jgi:choice-of-anchor A domain-containing protein|nr:choice-of-anchor A family protein [Gemmataceae bacterium]
MTHANPTRSARTRLSIEALEPRDVPSAYDLGDASAFNALFFTDMNAFNSDAEGRVAVGGHASIMNYGIGEKLPPNNTRDDLIAGDQLDFTNGQVFGGNIVYGNVGHLTSIGTPNGSVRQQTNVLPFGDIQTDLTAKSTAWGSEAPNGKTYIRYSTINLCGKHPQLDVFTVTPDQLANAKNIRIVVPFGSTVLINVPGADASIKDLGLNLRGTDPSHILWNFPEANELDVSGVGLKGSVLAPAAHLDFNNGVIAGTVVTQSMAGNGQFNLVSPNLHIEFRRESSLAGQVFIDDNGNDAKDLNEIGFDGADVYLTGKDTLGRNVNLTFLSSGGGFFNFGPIMAGTYTVKVVPPQRFSGSMLNGIPGTVNNFIVGVGDVNQVKAIGLDVGDHGVDYLLPLMPELN